MIKKNVTVKKKQKKTKQTKKKKKTRKLLNWSTVDVSLSTMLTGLGL